MQSLRKQGFKVRSDQISLPKNPTKYTFRSLNKLAVEKKIADSSNSLKHHESRLIQYIANGDEIFPDAVSPKLVLVKPGSDDELLFRYASLHWSIPVSAGYGRRLRFLIFDESNGKLIGLFGLGDPVYSIRARDDLIGWDKENKKKTLYHVMDAYVLGAVPPYSMLLCGKLIALLALSDKVRKVFKEKYFGRKAIISKEIRKPHLVMLTTTSALGRSSVYNRIRVNGFSYWRSIGFTQGSGEFHFSNGIYEDILQFVKQHCTATAKQKEWGKGFRNRRETIRKCLSELGLSSKLMYHGVRREIFVAPLGPNIFRYLRGEIKSPRYYHWSEDELACMFIERWMLKRAERKPEYKEFNRENYRLWP
jgi:hypothetical protein